MAEPHRKPPSDRRPGTAAVYGTILVSRVRAQTAYRLSFSLDLVGSICFALIELLEVYMIFHNTETLGGLGFAAALLVFGFARTGFSLADLLVGNLRKTHLLVRSGNLDVLLVRPASALAQIITLDFEPRKIGSVATSAVVLGLALSANEVDWTPARAVLAVLTPFTAAAVFAALWVVGGAWQLWLVDTARATDSLAIAGGYAANYPSSVFPHGLRQVFTFVIPAAFAGYLPTLVLLGLPGSPGLPAWLGWCTPVAAAAAIVVGARLWRLALRRYTSAGG